LSHPIHDIRVAAIPADLPQVERLWLEYLTWGNDQNEVHHGFRLPVRETVDHDLEAIAQFESPGGRLLLVWDGERAFGIGCLRGIGPGIGEIKRMYVEPSHRGTGAGSALLDALIAAAGEAGYGRLRLDSPTFMADAHRLYRRRGFEPIEPYPESEIPDDLKVWWVFMERVLTPAE
jgi:GNAT superfamily N-acetyltransferase